jgi:hypothetical protein
LIRDKALAYLTTASDQDLLRLCAYLRHWEATEENETKWLMQAVNAAPHVPFKQAASVQDKPRNNVEPPGEACSRIGSETKEKIYAALPATLDGVCNALKQRQTSTSALLKLLWNRNEVKYDGSTYYV